MKASAALVVLATALLMTSAGAAATRTVGSPAPKMYTVVFASNALPANVDKLISDAGGTIAVRLPAIGTLGVLSSKPGFAATISSVASVAAANKSRKTSVDPKHDVGPDVHESGGKHGKASGGGADPQKMPDGLGSQQWDKMRLNATSKGSYAIDRGRREVRVGLTDTGIDVAHPDIAPNLDLMDSRVFVKLADTFNHSQAVPGDSTIQDYSGHGTWTASAVAAPINDIGVSGVAPSVSIVELKTQDAHGDGSFLELADAIVYAADIGLDVVSSSVYGYTESCTGDPALTPPTCDDADYLAITRAAQYARDRGVVLLAAAGNDNLDVSAGSPQLLELAGEAGFVDLPATAPGVLAVSATGYNNEKTYYSNYGLGAVDLTAPGGDPHFQVPPPNYKFGGELVGAWSSTAVTFDDLGTTATVTDCKRKVCATYGLEHGTSMSTPNAAGVAALIISHYGNFSDRRAGPHLPVAVTETILSRSASRVACPDPATVVYNVPPNIFQFAYATCTGTPSSNGFYGAGMVDALAALGGGDNEH